MSTTKQTWDPNRYARNARFVSDLGMPVVELLAPQPGERILDLGCGDGALTQKLVDMGCVVVGVDGSAAQVAAAGARRLDARGMDGVRLTFAGAVTGWLETCGESLASALPAAERRAFREEVQELLRPGSCHAEGRWTADYVRLRLAADKAPR